MCVVNKKKSVYKCFYSSLRLFFYNSLKLTNWFILSRVFLSYSLLGFLGKCVGVGNLKVMPLDLARVLIIFVMDKGKA